MNTFGGINEKGLEQLILDINQYADDISDLFSKIDSKFTEVIQYYKGDSADAIYTYYNNMYNNQSAICNNIGIYADDLLEVLNKYRLGANAIVSRVQDYVDDVDQKIRQIEGKVDLKWDQK